MKSELFALSYPNIIMTAAKYRSLVAHHGFRDTETFLISDAGSETMFIYEKGVELPHFALFTQLKTQEGRDRDTCLRPPLNSKSYILSRIINIYYDISYCV